MFLHVTLIALNTSSVLSVSIQKRQATCHHNEIALTVWIVQSADRWVNVTHFLSNSQPMWNMHYSCIHVLCGLCGVFGLVCVPAHVDWSAASKLPSVEHFVR